MRKLRMKIDVVEGDINFQEDEPRKFQDGTLEQRVKV
jgi:hypothetical protein